RCRGTDGGLWYCRVDERFDVNDRNGRRQQGCGLRCGGTRGDDGADTGEFGDCTIAFDGMICVQGRVDTAPAEHAQHRCRVGRVSTEKYPYWTRAATCQ